MRFTATPDSRAVFRDMALLASSGASSTYKHVRLLAPFLAASPYREIRPGNYMSGMALLASSGAATFLPVIASVFGEAISQLKWRLPRPEKRPRNDVKETLAASPYREIRPGNYMSGMALLASSGASSTYRHVRLLAPFLAASPYREIRPGNYMSGMALLASSGAATFLPVIASVFGEAISQLKWRLPRPEKRPRNDVKETLAASPYREIRPAGR